MLRLSFATLLFALLSGTGSIALAEEPPHHAVNLVLFHPVGTNQNTTISTNFRLNIFYGHVGSIRGVDLSGIVARTDGDLRWVQLAGVHSWTGGDVRGVTATGGLSWVGGDFRGVQITGLVNYDRADFTGVQFGGLFNFVQGRMHGLQLSSTFNVIEGEGLAAQIAGVVNLASRDTRGMQITAGLNFVNGSMRGLQVAFVNAATDMDGIQVGALNLSRYMRGMQFGILNIGRELEGIPVAPATFVENGTVDWIIAGSSFAAVSTGVRTLVNDWTSIVWVGVGDVPEDKNKTAFLGWNWGRMFPFAGTWQAGADIGYVHVIPESEDDNQHFALQFRALIEKRFHPKVSVLLGLGANVRYSNYATNASSETDPLIYLGVPLF